MVLMLLLYVNKNKRGEFIKVEKTSCSDVVVAIDVDLDDSDDVAAGRELEQEGQVHQGRDETLLACQQCSQFCSRSKLDSQVAEISADGRRAQIFMALSTAG